MHFGGSKVTESSEGQKHSGFLPGYSALVAAISKEISNELFQKNNQELFIQRLVLVLLDKIWRMLNVQGVAKINPKYLQQGRIQRVVTYIQKNMH